MRTRLKSAVILLFLNPIQLSAQNKYFEESARLFESAEVTEIRVSIAENDLAFILNPQNAQSDKLFPARVIFKNELIPGDTLEQVGFRLRGNTSRQAQKKSFKLDFNAFKKGRDYLRLEKLNVNGEHNDPLRRELFELAAQCNDDAVNDIGRFLSLRQMFSSELVDLTGFREGLVRAYTKLGNARKEDVHDAIA